MSRHDLFSRLNYTTLIYKSPYQFLTKYRGLVEKHKRFFNHAPVQYVCLVVIAESISDNRSALQRHVHSKRRAGARCAFHGERTAVRGHDVAGDGEAHAQPLGIAAVGGKR
jgi:hypothetical protein